MTGFETGLNRLPRPQLAQGLLHCGCPVNVLTVLMSWLEGAHYEIVSAQGPLH